MEHSEYWNLEEIVNDQKVAWGLFKYESYLLKQLELDSQGKLFIRIVGCGSGRELLPLMKFFPNAYFICEDVAIKMIEQAKILVGENTRVEFNVVSISQMKNNPKDKYDLCICFNSVLNYLCPHQERIIAFSNIYESLKPDGYLLGVVHNAYDTWPKTIYFLFREILMFNSKNKYERRTGNFSIINLINKVESININYFTRKSLKEYIVKFKLITLFDMKEFNQKVLIAKYLPKHSNYLAFLAKK
jgi:SAM-dependent methyltransferase